MNEQKKWVFKTTQNDDIIAAALIEHMAKTGIKTVGLIGTKAEVMRIMVAAHWYPADPLTLESCLEIAEATVLKRPYDAAPVSSLYLFGRKEEADVAARRVQRGDEPDDQQRCEACDRREPEARERHEHARREQYPLHAPAPEAGSRSTAQ